MAKTSTVELNGMKNFLFKNWAENNTCQPSLYFEPNTVEELKEILELAKANGKKVKCIGCKHSISDIACTNDYMVSLVKLDRILEIDTQKLQVKVEGGANVEKLNKVLEDNGMAFSVFGALMYQTIGGAISTGHHGSSLRHGNLSDYVVEVDLMLASGEIKRFSIEENPDELRGVALSLGALGIIVAVKLQLEPAFNLECTTYSRTVDEVFQSFDTLINSAEYTQFFWYPHTNYFLCYEINRTKKPITKKSSSWIDWILSTLIGFYLYEAAIWLGIYIPAIIPYVNLAFFKLFCAPRKTVVDTSYNIFKIDCFIKQNNSEVAVPLNDGPQFFLRLKKWLEDNPQVKICSNLPLRFVRRDNVWLSPAYQRDACYISILSPRPYGIECDHADYWKAYHDLVNEYQGRPHWAKENHYTGKDLKRVYPRYKDFMKLKNQLDPNGLFMNEYLERALN